MTSMTAVQRVVGDREQARTLRKLYALTGDSIASDPNTWTEDAPQTTTASLRADAFDSNESEWDSEV